MINILVADDDSRILRLISDFLKKENFCIYTAKNGQEALDTFKKESIDLVVLDIMMPILNGWDVCNEIRKISNIPILILTARDSDIDELKGFDIGADEYISKPFNPLLLVVRIKNLLKREKHIGENTIRYEGIFLELDKHIVKIDNAIIELTPTEYELLKLFLNNIGRVFERNALLDYVWGDSYIGDTRTVDTHVNRLRNKLRNKSNLLKTIRGFGYKFGV